MGVVEECRDSRSHDAVGHWPYIVDLPKQRPDDDFSAPSCPLGSAPSCFDSCARDRDHGATRHVLASPLYEQVLVYNTPPPQYRVLLGLIQDFYFREEQRQYTQHIKRDNGETTISVIFCTRTAINSCITTNYRSRRQTRECKSKIRAQHINTKRINERWIATDEGIQQKLY